MDSVWIAKISSIKLINKDIINKFEEKIKIIEESMENYEELLKCNKNLAVL